MKTFLISVILYSLSLATSFAIDTKDTNNDVIWIGKSDSAQSCSTKPGIDPGEMGKELTKASIEIKSKKKLRDSKMRIQMCGADKGNMNAFLIQKKDLEKATNLGFEKLKDSE